jgi:hypothetical protein
LIGVSAAADRARRGGRDEPVNDGGRLRGYNTEHEVRPNLEFAVLGNGGMAKAVVAALRDAGFTSGTVVAPRSLDKARPLAEQYGFDAAVGAPPRPVRLLVNVTPIGMAGGPTICRSPASWWSRPRWCSTSSRSRRRRRWCGSVRS